jgi:hypothetical protein
VGAAGRRIALAAALSPEEAELKAIVDAIEAYAARRWPLGRDPAVPHGKG